MDPTKKVMAVLLVEMILGVNQEDEVVLTKQKGVELTFQEEREYEQRSCGWCEHGKYIKD